MVFELVETAVDAFYVGAVALVGVAGLYGGLEYTASALRLWRGGTTSITDLLPGTTTTVAGRPRTDDPLIAPLSGEPCVAVHLTEWTAFFGDGTVNETALELSGLEWWEDDAASEVSVGAAVPFSLRAAAEVAVDPSRPDAKPVPGLGRDDAVPLDPREAFDLREPAETARESMDGLDAFPERLAGFVAAHPDLRGDRGDVRRRRYVERRVTTAGDLYVTGRVAADGADRRLVHEGTFVLSDTDAGATARHRAGVAAVLLAIGVGGLWLAAVGASARLGISIPPLPFW